MRVECSVVKNALSDACSSLREGAVSFAQRLVRTRSGSGDESAAAALMMEEMRLLGYDDVFLDKAGNAVGVVRGRDSSLPAVLFNAHLDTVAVDESEPWPYPAFEGKIADGALWGRGACDTKGPLAAQVYGVAALKKAGLLPERDIVVAGVVQEEVGGLGTRAFLRGYAENVSMGARRFAACIIGEPSSGSLALGHRGRIEVEAAFRGRAAHAAQPRLGKNALYPMGRFLRKAPRLKGARQKPLGATSISPTRLVTFPPGANVIPSEARLTLDWRTVPADTEDVVLKKVRALADGCLAEGFTFEASVPRKRLRSYAGVEEERASARLGFVTERKHPVVKEALRALRGALGRGVRASYWRFATDGGDVHVAGIPTVGYGEGDESLAHTSHEHILVERLARGVYGNAALAWALSRYALPPERDASKSGAVSFEKQTQSV